MKKLLNTKPTAKPSKPLNCGFFGVNPLLFANKGQIMNIKKLLKLTDIESGKLWTVRIVAQGDKYGRKMCLTHDENYTIVEFYDAAYNFVKSPDNEILGQFVARYDADSLLSNKYSPPIGNGQGLNLDGGVPDWTINGKAMIEVSDFLIRYLDELSEPSK